MKTAELPKFEWGRIDESNAGHTRDEWGKQEDKPKNNNIIEAYDLSWNVDKKNNGTDKEQILLEEILSNASYVYVENDQFE